MSINSRSVIDNAILPLAGINCFEHQVSPARKTSSNIKMTSEFFLPAGSCVKHGTAAVHLHSILEAGLQAGHSRHTLRSLTEERPKAEAVYVGGPAAYFGAWAAAGALIKEYESAEENFKELVSGDPEDLQKAVFKDPPFAIPVVLNIELREDTALVGDEDFAMWLNGSDGSLLKHPASTDEAIWGQFLSGGLMRANGIPAEWITNIEFPRLIRIGDMQDKSMRQLVDDCVLLAAGVSQNHRLLPARQVQTAHGFWTPEVSLSQRRLFLKSEVEGLFALRALAEPAQRFHNLVTQYNLVASAGRDILDLKFV
jgi:hypothetical protein